MKKSILIKSEEDFNKVKNMLEGDLFLDYNEVYLTHPTSVVISDVKKSNRSRGSIGCAISQQKDGYQILDINFNPVNI